MIEAYKRYREIWVAEAWWNPGFHRYLCFVWGVVSVGALLASLLVPDPWPSLLFFMVSWPIFFWQIKMLIAAENRQSVWL